jgi:hypothetical protein
MLSAVSNDPINLVDNSLQQLRLGPNLTDLVYFYFFAFRLCLLTKFEV